MHNWKKYTIILQGDLSGNKIFKKSSPYGHIGTVPVRYSRNKKIAIFYYGNGAVPVPYPTVFSHFYTMLTLQLSSITKKHQKQSRSFDSSWAKVNSWSFIQAMTPLICCDPTNSLRENCCLFYSSRSTSIRFSRAPTQNSFTFFRRKTEKLESAFWHLIRRYQSVNRPIFTLYQDVVWVQESSLNEKNSLQCKEAHQIMYFRRSSTY